MFHIQMIIPFLIAYVRYEKNSVDTEPTHILEDTKVVFDIPLVQINKRSEKIKKKQYTCPYNQINCSQTVTKMESAELYDYSHDFVMSTILVPSGLASPAMIFVALHVLILYFVLIQKSAIMITFQNSQMWTQSLLLSLRIGRLFSIHHQFK